MTTTLPPVASAPLTRLRRQSWIWLALGLLGALFLLAWRPPAWWLAVSAEDIGQSRLDVAPAPPAPGRTLEQTFMPRHNGLEVITVTLARTGGGEGQGGTLALALWDSAGQEIGRVEWPNEQLRHNQVLELRLPAQPASAGQRYMLRLEGNEANVYSAWAYSLDVYDEGALAGADGAAELQFTTRYRLLPADALRSAWSLGRESAPILAVTALLLLLPGSVLLMLTSRVLPRLDLAAWLSLSAALGMAALPLLWQWLSLAEGRWRAWSLLLLLALLALALVLLLWRRRPRLGPFHWHHLWLALLLLLGLVVRLLAVRDLSFPPWVDASRHALITQIMAERGQMLAVFEPYLPVADVPYHFGFHTLAASLALLGGWPLPRLLLLLGQGMGAAVPLALYGATWMVTRRRGAALLAAFLVALPFYFPGYYVSWGRFTQLSSLIILPLLLALTWHSLRGARGWRAAWPLLALLAAGLALLHFRVFLLYLVFCLLALLAARGRGWRFLLAAGVLGAVLVAPYLLLLARHTMPSGVLTAAPEDYAAFPSGYLTIGWERAFWWLAVAAWLAALFATARGRPWARLPLLLAAWPGAIVLVLNGPLAAAWLLNLNSAYIVFFVPLALILAIVASRIPRVLSRRRILRPCALAIGGFLVPMALLFGARQQITIVNPETVLARPSDVAALAWIDSHLPDDARVAVNAWKWLGETWTGSDGGAWLLPLTGRASTTPPVDYIFNPALAQGVDAFNRAAQGRPDWSEPAAAAWLQTQDVSHIYVGVRGGFFDPADLARNPAFCTLYRRDGAFIFGWRDVAGENCLP
jgi:hypothetical protein